MSKSAGTAFRCVPPENKHARVPIALRWKWVVSFTLRPSYPQYLLGRRLDPKADLDVVAKKFLPLQGIEPKTSCP
jgi:hypothetical protein